MYKRQELEKYRQLLLGTADLADEDKTPEYLNNELVFQLMDFHRREAKPAWWAFFERAEKSQDELIEDPDCIGNLQIDSRFEAEKVKKSIRYHFKFTSQETKLHSGSRAVIVLSLIHI